MAPAQTPGNPAALHLKTTLDVIVIKGNHIESVGPHSKAVPAGAKLVDAANFTAVPDLIESHSHLQKDYGEALHRAWLAFGITTVRSPGNTPYEGVLSVGLLQIRRQTVEPEGMKLAN